MREVRDFFRFLFFPYLNIILKYNHMHLVFGLVFCLTSRSTIFQSFRDGASAGNLKVSCSRSLGSNPGPLALESEALPLSHPDHLVYLVS